MIFLWIGKIVDWMRWLFVAPIPPPYVPKINVNAPCPNCGHEQGTIRAEENQGKPACSHRCAVCHAKWFEPPVYSITNGLTFVPSDDKAKG